MAHDVLKFTSVALSIHRANSCRYRMCAPMMFETSVNKNAQLSLTNPHAVLAKINVETIERDFGYCLTAHAQNRHISTSRLKFDITNVFSSVTTISCKGADILTICENSNVYVTSNSYLKSFKVINLGTK